ncbi:hypothetical protein GM415_11965 [Pseudodesulfovibrio cashew]|uniref:Yip1 domain-containing protein n=1 Tax=Pseudodesulfovibrio cashew TaxID=2678688 RepID=A0A6I6JI02_9BACT|nr:YIP1 family protein [Pseudodesulfovibrio cashew]QGY40809.1 hypothetical protein GM415_11965 [Pseudodesulfovibrio cashew]
MEIICPECQFSREVDESKIPARSQVATCPKCKTKFQFRDLPEEQDDFGFAQDDSVPDAGTVAPAPEPVPERHMAPPPDPTEQDADLAQEEDEGPVFPHIAQPGEAPGEELWDKLHDMAPPRESGAGEEPSPERTRKPPVIGAKWKPKGEAKPESEDPWNRDSIPKSLPLEDDQPVPGWTGQFSEDFPDPMMEDFKDDGGDLGPLVPPPFEQLDRYGFFHGLYMTIKLILLSPRLFFSVMPVGGGLSKPLTFTILLTLVQSLVQYFWGLAGLSGPLGMDGTTPASGATGMLTPVIMLLFVPALIAAGQFIMTGFYHLLLTLMKAGDQGFEGTFRALAYANAPIILGIFPMPISSIEIGWMFVAAVWGLFLTIIGLKHIHKTSYAKVIPVALIPLLLGMIAGLYAFQAGMTTI